MVTKIEIGKKYGNSYGSLFTPDYIFPNGDVAGVIKLRNGCEYNTFLNYRDLEIYRQVPEKKKYFYVIYTFIGNGPFATSLYTQEEFIKWKKEIDKSVKIIEERTIEIEETVDD